MIVHTANEFTAFTTYDRQQLYSKHSIRDSIHLILRDDRAISVENIGKLLTTSQIDDVRNGRHLLILDFSLESCFHFVDTIYICIVNGLNIPEENLLFVCSSHDYKDYVYSKAKYFNKKPIATEFYCFFESLSKKFVGQYKLNDSNPLVNDHDKVYINLNRFVRPHRTALMSLLYMNDLLDKGYNSFTIQPSTDLHHLSRSWEDNLRSVISLFPNLNLQNALTFQEKLPLILDTEDFNQNLAYTNQNDVKRYIDKSLISLVTETNYISGTPLFLTEKTFKPIGLKHPFIIAGRTGTLKFLKTLGYQTFSDIINEEYDLEQNDEKRLLLIINEIKRLCNLTELELLDFKNKALPIVEHNYKNLLSKKKYLENLI